MVARTPPEVIETAKDLWVAGTSPKEIAKQLNLKSPDIIYVWKKRYNWVRNKNDAIADVVKKFHELMVKSDKTEQEWQEFGKLATILGNLGKSSTKNNNEATSQKRQKKKHNDISHIELDDFYAFEEANLYPHQKVWLKAGDNRTRFILKSRQIGATFTFSYEAFKTAVLKGHNQIFISSTKAQAEVFKSFIIKIANQHFDCKLQGNPIKLSNNAELHFLSPNSFADSRSGDVYFDEVFKTKNFADMERVAAPMATLSDYRKTYFSSPTAVSHQAYSIWSGERFTQTNSDITIDVTNLNVLKHGRKDADGIWRCACTVHHAIDMGWDLVDLNQLKLETPNKKTFGMLYECKFFDDSDSVFSMQDILDCAVNSKNLDKNYNGAVTIGYDPAGIGDNASIAVLALPTASEPAFKVLETYNLKHVKATDQTRILRELTGKYDVHNIEIDSTGPGIFVGDFVEHFFPRVKRVHYNPEYKNRMVQKALNIFQTNRLQYDKNDEVLPLSFLTVKQKVTSNGTITYASDRNDKVGHGDLAWAVMHALMAEELAYDPDKKPSRFTVHSICWESSNTSPSYIDNPGRLSDSAYERACRNLIKR
jgi:uncharacterized protein YjcR